jgi:hypothetical protein
VVEEEPTVRRRLLEEVADETLLNEHTRALGRIPIGVEGLIGPLGEPHSVG